MLKPTKILVPTDFSRYSDRALKEAAAIAEEYGARMYVLHVVEERIGSALQDYYSDISISPATIKRRQGRLLRAAKTKMDKQLDRLRLAGQAKIETEARIGVPYKEILRFQEDNGVDLIVISSLGHAGVARFLIGSVARNVLKGSTCPVLLSKSEENG